MEIFDRTEPLYKLFTERVGILSVLLPYFGYAHHGYQLLNKMCKGSRLLLDSNPFDKILKDIKMDYDLFVDKFDSIHKTITCIQHSYNSFVNMSIHLKITNESLDLLESEFKLFQNCKVIIDEVPKTQYILMNGLKYFLNEHSNSIKIQISEWSWYQLFSDFIPYINTIHFKHKFICISDFITNYSNENSQSKEIYDN